MALTLRTELDDRVLRYDGVSIVDPALLGDLLMRGLTPSNLRVTKIDEEVKLFNQFSPTDELKLDSTEPITFNREYQLPEKYANLEVDKFLINVFDSRIEELGYSEAELSEAADRFWTEYNAFKRNGLLDLLKCLIYVLDKFHEHSVVYGVGRGSSCASFILFLIGVHMVDPIKFKIPVEEFIREEAGGEL